MTSYRTVPNEQPQLFLKLRIDNVSFSEPHSFLITIFLKSYGMKLKTNISDVVSQPYFVENTFYIPVNSPVLEADDLLTFEAFVVDENVHTLLGRGVVNPAQFLYTPKPSSKYLILTTFQKRKEVIVGQFQLTLQFTSVSDRSEITLNESQKESNYLNQLLARSFLEGVENPLYEEQLLEKVRYEKEIDLLDPSNYKEKWRLYSQTLFERQSTIKEYRSTLDKYDRILRAQQMIRTDLAKGNRLLKQLYNFNMNRLRGEENIDFHLHIDQKLRRMNEQEIFGSMKQQIRQVQDWQRMNRELEEFLLKSKSYIDNLGQLLLMKENSKQGYKESIVIRETIEQEVNKSDYYKQKIERQSNCIDRLSRTMENVVSMYSNNHHLQTQYIDLRGDLLQAQSNIAKIFYGESPMQIEQFNYLIQLSRRLNRLSQQQKMQIETIKNNLISNDTPSQLQSLQAELKGAQLRVNALEEQIKINSQNFSNEITKLQVQIQVKNNRMQTTSLSNISYKLPSNVYEEF